MNIKRTATVVGLAATLIATSTACSSKRQISVEGTGSTQVQGTSWYRFCDGPNAFIWVQSRTDSEPDELEAIIYDHWSCVDTSPANDESTGSTRPDADSDGTFDDEEN